MKNAGGGDVLLPPPKRARTRRGSSPVGGGRIRAAERIVPPKKRKGWRVTVEEPPLNFPIAEAPPPEMDKQIERIGLTPPQNVNISSLPPPESFSEGRTPDLEDNIEELRVEQEKQAKMPFQFDLNLPAPLH